MTSPVQRKIARLRLNDSARVRVLDLFAGCGGLSLGFHSAGFEIVGAAEIDPTAARTHANNFFKLEQAATVNLHARPRDITQIEPEDLIREFNLGAPRDAIDVIIGGPPCQAYSRIGRAKLREVARRPDAFKVDPRANLYLRYLHYIDRLKPLAILMENVPDILNFGGHNIAEEICEALVDLGYVARFSLINSASFGVPQIRDRVYMIAYRRELTDQIVFPTATHRCVLPIGYLSQRAVALKMVHRAGQSSYQADPPPLPSLPAAVTARAALDDLPSIETTSSYQRGMRRFDILAPYRKARVSDFAKSMRNWPNFQSENGVFDHVMRSLPRDGRIFQAMPHGCEYPAALQIALSLFEDVARQQNVKAGSAKWQKLKRSMVPPYDPNKFPNRWWKLEPNKPVRTLTAHIGKDTYTHIHYDGCQQRVISVREAARLQSFPDGFVFSGAMNSAYRQIGNAVPPLMARALALVIMASVRSGLETRISDKTHAVVRA